MPLKGRPFLGCHISSEEQAPPQQFAPVFPTTPPGSLPPCGLRWLQRIMGTSALIPIQQGKDDLFPRDQVKALGFNTAGEFWGLWGNAHACMAPTHLQRGGQGISPTALANCRLQGGPPMVLTPRNLQPGVAQGWSKHLGLQDHQCWHCRGLELVHRKVR